MVPSVAGLSMQRVTSISTVALSLKSQSFATAAWFGLGMLPAEKTETANGREWTRTMRTGVAVNTELFALIGVHSRFKAFPSSRYGLA
jgi:hypothetical protein